MNAMWKEIYRERKGCGGEPSGQSSQGVEISVHQFWVPEASESHSHFVTVTRVVLDGELSVDSEAFNAGSFWDGTAARVVRAAINSFDKLVAAHPFKEWSK